jgi:DNA repair exonuclease SbcCD ATPase subunit
MATNGTLNQEELSELVSRLEWMDEERRKTGRKLAEMEQRLNFQEREIETREQRIKELEDRLSKTNSQLARLSQLDAQLRQFKDELVQLIDQYDDRNTKTMEETTKLRRVEHEIHSRELAEIKKELGALGRLENSMELRQAEEARLANLIGLLKGRLSGMENQVDNWNRDLKFLEESERKNARTITELQTNFFERGKKFEPIDNRLEVLAFKVGKVETTIPELTELIAETRQSIKNWSEQVQIGEHERNQRLENWRRVLDEQQDRLDYFNKEWIKISDQYKEAGMAVQTLGEWQTQIENQQREAGEMARVEANRLRALWDNFQLEQEKHWKAVELDREQRWNNSQRHEREMREELLLLEAELEKITQDKDTLCRVQTAQAEAVKQLSRVWIEEVEKAITHNPNSRRQPTRIQVREE